MALHEACMRVQVHTGTRILGCGPSNFFFVRKSGGGGESKQILREYGFTKTSKITDDPKVLTAVSIFSMHFQAHLDRRSKINCYSDPPKFLLQQTASNTHTRHMHFYCTAICKAKNIVVAKKIDLEKEEKEEEEHHQVHQTYLPSTNCPCQVSEVGMHRVSQDVVRGRTGREITA